MYTKFKIGDVVSLNTTHETTKRKIISIENNGLEIIYEMEDIITKDKGTMKGQYMYNFVKSNYNEIKKYIKKYRELY